MISGGVEVILFAQNHLMSEAKFGNNPVFT